MDTIQNFYTNPEKDNNYLNKYHDEHKNRIQWVIKRFGLDKLENKRILDIGCGRGDYFKYLNSNNTFVGIDGAIIGNDKKLVPFLNIRTNINNEFAYLLDNEERFDVVICSETLEHCTDIYRILDEIKKLLVSDGLFLITIPSVEMQHNYIYPALMANPNNWEQFLEQMSFNIIDADKFKDGWPSNCWLCRNKSYYFSNMMFHKSEDKFRGKSPLEQVNI